MRSRVVAGAKNSSSDFMPVNREFAKAAPSGKGNPRKNAALAAGLPRQAARGRGGARQPDAAAWRVRTERTLRLFCKSWNP